MAAPASGSPPQTFGIEPDTITTAKALTSGYQPLSALLVGDRIASDAGREGRRVQPRLHLFRSSGGLRRGAEEPRDHREARGWSSASGTTPVRISPRRCRSGSPAIRWSAKCARVGLMGAIEIVKDKATRERFLPVGKCGRRRARPRDRQRHDAARHRRHDDPVAAADLDPRDDRHGLRPHRQGARSCRGGPAQGAEFLQRAGTSLPAWPIGRAGANNDVSMESQEQSPSRA